VLADADLTRRGANALEAFAEPMSRFPLAFGHALCAADLAVHGAEEIALIGDQSAADFRALTSELGQCYVPSLVVAGGPASSAGEVALLADRPMRDGRATAYVCHRHVCEEPVTEPAALRELLRR
jgi:hypothetical protein